MLKRPGGKSVIKKHEVLIVGYRNGVLPNGGQAAGCSRKRKPPQRRELIPLFSRVSENPFDRVVCVIDADDKIFPAGNNQRVICSIVGNGVVMEPVVSGLRSWKDELAGIISSLAHGMTDNAG